MCAQMRYFILSDNIGEILVRLEGFELSTPGSGDLQMRMINYMKFSESDTIAFPAVSMPSHSHLGNFRDANCARLCAHLLFIQCIQQTTRDCNPEVTLPSLHLYLVPGLFL